MSSLCTITSPSQVGFGPGGCFTEFTTDSKLASVSAGVAPRCAATPFSWTLSKLNPEPIILPKNAGGVSLAAEVMWASTSRTVQLAAQRGLSPVLVTAAPQVGREGLTLGVHRRPDIHESSPRTGASSRLPVLFGKRQIS